MLVHSRNVSFWPDAPGAQRERWQRCHAYFNDNAGDVLRLIKILNEMEELDGIFRRLLLARRGMFEPSVGDVFKKLNCGKWMGRVGSMKSALLMEFNKLKKTYTKENSRPAIDEKVRCFFSDLFDVVRYYCGVVDSATIAKRIERFIAMLPDWDGPSRWDVIRKYDPFFRRKMRKRRKKVIKEK
jgi:hypothetical protein